MSVRNLMVAAATAASLAGCAGNNVMVVEPVGPVGSYYDGDFEYATRNGAIRTEVAGLPFAVAPEALKSRVLSLMDRQNRGVPAQFVAEDGDKTDPAYKVVVVFNLKRGYSGHDLCSGGADRMPTTPPGERVIATMAFCFGDQMKTEVEGRVGGVKGLDDPKFAALIRQTTLALIPAYDSHGGDNNPPP